MLHQQQTGQSTSSEPEPPRTIGECFRVRFRGSSRPLALDDADPSMFNGQATRTLHPALELNLGSRGEKWQGEQNPRGQEGGETMHHAVMYVETERMALGSGLTRSMWKRREI